MAVNLLQADDMVVFIWGIVIVLLRIWCGISNFSSSRWIEGMRSFVGSNRDESQVFQYLSN